ncbi:MAG: sensor domain-containing diguanylate cyclase [Thermodesulfovibrio sp.]|nr:sensor domain-containing diguanylate cyclase [Thermodesulfovibrio sp.]
MKNFLFKLGEILEIKNLKEYDNEQLRNLILKEIRKRIRIEKSLLQLSEDLSCGVELSLKIMSSINRIIDRIYNEKNIYTLISYCFEEFIKQLPTDNITFVEKDPKRERLVLKVASGKIKLEEFRGKILNFTIKLAHRAFEEGKFIYFPDIKEDKNYTSNISISFPIRSFLGVPVKVKNQIIGVINFSHSEVDAFDDLDIFYFVSIVQFLSAILTLNRLYNENLKFNEKLQKEVNKKTRELQKINKELYKVSITDSLTGINNRRFFFQRFEEEYARVLRHGNSFCVVLFDLDHLKKINDNYGHPEGDRLLKIFAKVLKSNKRKEDVVARTGGDEFACILVGTSLDGAKKTAERIKEDFKKKYKKDIVSVSGAVGCISKDESFRFYKNYKKFFKELDKALFKAKLTRDRIEVIETK